MRLLLVEDDSMIGEGLRQGLRSAGYVVDWVQDGQAADTAARSTPYDLLLLDLGLPGKDGLQVLRAIHARDADLAVIVITARDGLTDRLAGLDAGADDYLVKPFALAELVARVRAVSRRRSGRPHPELRAGPLRMDPARHLVWLHDQAVEVSAKDFSLLRLLMDREGVVVSREHLEEKLYGWNEEIASNAVEVRIHNLRKKLGSDVIQTVRGVGYRIRVQP
jgi:two-component system response regulator QseB